MPAAPTGSPDLGAAGGCKQLEAAVRTLLTGLGEDVGREGLRDTPKRVAKALLDAGKGYQQTASGVIGSAYFHEPIVRDGNEGLVLVRDITFASTSEETLLPFYGRCHIAYVPHNGVVLGLSKLSRLMRVFSKRLQSQERLGREVATALQRQLHCQGVAVVTQACHLTMNSTQPSLHMTTACISGCFTDAASSTFQEVLCMAGIDFLAPGSLLQLPDASEGQERVKRSPSSLSGDLAPGYGGVQGLPVPPSTPDLSESLGDSDSHSADSTQGGPSSAVDDKACHKLSSSDLTGSSDHDLSEHDSDSEAPQLGDHFSQPQQQSNLLIHHLSSHDLSTNRPSASTGHQEVRAGRSGISSPGSPLPAGAAAACPPQLLTSALAAGQAVLDPRRAASADVMEQAVQTLVTAMGDCPHRPGLLGSARRYVMTLLSATSGYTRQLPPPLWPSPQAVVGTVSTAAACRHGASTGHVHSSCPCCQPSATGTTACAVLPWLGPGSTTDCHHLKVPFTSQCEHHMLPFYGHAHVVYTPAAAGSLEGQQPAVEADSGAQNGRQAAETAAIIEVVRLYSQRLQVQERITHQVADGVVGVLGSTSVLVVVDAAHMCMVARGVENHGGHTTTMAARGEASGDAAWRARALQKCRAAGLS